MNRSPYPSVSVGDDGLPDLDALPPMAMTARADLLCGELRSRRAAGATAEALLVTNLTNIRYLTGFTGSAARLLVTDLGLTLVTDGRYATQAPAELAEAGVDATIEVLATASEQDNALASAVRAAGIAVLGLEADHLSWSAARAARDNFTGIELEPVVDAVEALRITKDAGEVARIEAAAMIADAALERTRHLLAPGITEAEFALALDTEIRRLGASGNSFPTIVGSGPNGALPHVSPGSRQVTEGDLVVVDFGAVVDGYCSDMTRTFAVGAVPELSKKMLAVVAEAQAAGVATVAPGVAASVIDAACRDLIGSAGWGDAFIHGTGHGVGLDIHEAPRVAKTSDATVEQGYVVTVEPGIYLPDCGGVRIEDTVVVTESGCRALTHSPKDPELTLATA